MKKLYGFMFAAAAAFALTVSSASAQTPAPTESAADLREIEYGKDIFKTKANCQFCHKWDGSGDQGYGGNALPLRTTELTLEQFVETVKCGRIGTGMPYHDRFAYNDKRCYDTTREELGNDTPPIANEYLQPREIAAVAKYVFARQKGRGVKGSYEDCLDFWGKESKQCEQFK